MTASVRDRARAGQDAGQEQDAFLRDLLESQAVNHEDESARLAAHGLAQQSEALPEVSPSSGVRERLLAALPTTGRFARFAEATAKLLDLGIEQAKALLDRLENDALFEQELPGVCFFWCEGGPAVANAVRGFVRVEAGSAFPDHEHIGDEIVLVLQGSFVDASRGLTFHPGDTDVMQAGTSHAFYVPEGGPDLLKLSVTQVGIRAMGHTYLPRA